MNDFEQYLSPETSLQIPYAYIANGYFCAMLSLSKSYESRIYIIYKYDVV